VRLSEPESADRGRAFQSCPHLAQGLSGARIDRQRQYRLVAGYLAVVERVLSPRASSSLPAFSSVVCWQRYLSEIRLAAKISDSRLLATSTGNPETCD